MRFIFPIACGIAILISENALAQQTAAPVGQPLSAAALGLPRISASPTYAPIFRAAAPASDPLVGDYSPAARLSDAAGIRTDSTPVAHSVNSPDDRFDPGVPPIAPSEPLFPNLPDRRPPPSQSRFGGGLGDYFNKDGNWNFSNFQSDHCFDDFISPMSNPFLAEDPRALTEIRPVLMFQTIPHNSAINGGNLQFYGLRGSIAFTDRLSITLDKLGGLSMNPGVGSTVSGGTGLTELWLGPKFTFYRDDQSGTIAAAGAIFQIPTGPDKIFQDTGDLSITPYGTAAQSFGKTSWGTFHVLDTFGYSFSVNDQRSNYLYNTIHLDFDVANYQHVYPLLELNWYHYTSNGQARYLPFEGGDIANVGSAAAGRDYLNLAFGSRFKVSEAIQFGINVEFPLINEKDLYNFRLGIDFIWRY